MCRAAPRTRPLSTWSRTGALPRPHVGVAGLTQHTCSDPIQLSHRSGHWMIESGGRGDHLGWGSSFRLVRVPMNSSFRQNVFNVT
eukprot:562224-Rhodomonas_salina.3